MEFHEIADIFPMMIGDDYRALHNDITESGLLEPIVTYEGKILDGRNRYTVCLETGVAWDHIEYQGEDPLGYVISKNLHRRHLTTAQRGVIANELASMRQGERTDITPSAILPKVSQSGAASLLDVSDRTLREVRSIERDAPELIPRMKAGEITIPEAKKVIKAQEKAHHIEELIQAAADVPASDRYRLLHGDVLDMMRTLDDASIDVIVSDPPYPKEYIYLYGVMASEAKRVLKPGGLCVLMVAHYYLPELLKQIEDHLKYYWVGTYLVPGSSAKSWQRNVNIQQKPLLFFANGDYTGKWLTDVCKSDARDKDHHEWGQSESGMQDMIEKYTMPNDLVLDPFCGAGTTGVSALRLGRRFIGIDNNLDTINLAKGRIEHEQV